ncbi:hypothetical protein CDCA_CDCA01G0459 [Cyanidium caldarium]|uniref:Inositol 2-dehydrogenase n=1 Tax=Cyanidium caldarium TaxID=2771 RepID=A0AAV9IQ43_CYACA|nr:hypothetical protein CDCA_CDCA01G0459 [Cyanidium caldarium]
MSHAMSFVTCAFPRPIRHPRHHNVSITRTRMETVGVGVIGAGRIGQVHAHALSRLPNVELRGVADPMEVPGREMAHRFNTAYYTDYAELLEDERVRGVVICSPTPFHAEQMMQAARAGKHIFCEKPISNDLITIDRCLDVVKASGVKLLVGFQRRFDSNFRHVHDQVRRGVIGDVRLFHIHSRDPAPPPAEYLAKSGGIFLDMCSHDYDMARFVTGQEIEEVYVVGRAFDAEAEAANDLDTQITVLKMSGGAMGTIDNSRRCAYGYDQRIEVFGAKGSLQGLNKGPHTVVYGGVSGHLQPRSYDFFMDRYAEAYANIMNAFVEMIDQDAEPPVSGVDGRVPILAAMAAARSVKENRPVRLTEVDVALVK